ncbi:hypothetical protein ACIGGF_02965 [Rhodococcus sp. NPDC078407]|uniref:hypothetical protein n=1 Tax=Rhodococcus sp. NPDC078407 TaxID=3364509 RepID=UPI0037C61CE9
MSYIGNGTKSRTGPNNRMGRSPGLTIKISGTQFYFLAAFISLSATLIFVTWPVAMMYTALAIFAGLALNAAARSERFTWIVLVALLGCSGQTLKAGFITILPEHVALVILASHIIFNSSNIAAGVRFSSWIKLAAWSAALWILTAFVTSAIYAVQPLQSIRLTLWLTIGLATVVLIHRTRLDAARMAIDAAYTIVAYSIFSIAGWALSPAGSESIFVEQDYASSYQRAQGLMLEPNLAASYVCAFLALSLAFYRDLSKRLFYAQALLSIVLVALSVTRTVIPIVIAFTLIYFLLTAKPLFKGIVVAAIVATVVALQIGAASLTITVTNDSSELVVTAANRLNEFGSTDTGTGRLRAETTDQALSEIASANPFIGRGTNAYPQTHSSNQSSTGQVYFGFWWIALIYDVGLIGFIFFCTAFAATAFGIGIRSLPLLLSFSLIAVTTNPIWYGFYWAALGVLVKWRSNQTTRGIVEVAKPKRQVDYAHSI